MNIIPYIFYPLTIGLIIFTFVFFKYPRYAIAGLLIAKPIIDLTWDYNIFLNVNFLKLYAGLFVILGVIYIIVKRVPILTSRHTNIPSLFHGEPTQTTSSPLKGEDKGGGERKSLPRTRFGGEGATTSNLIRILWLLFLILNIVSIFIISDAHLLLGKINYFLRILTGFVALIMFAYLFDFEKDQKFVLSIFIIAGIFPILLWLIPVIIGNPIISNDPLRRIMGPYQNFWNFNFYAIQTLIFCLAYLSFSQLRNFSSSQPHNSPSSKLHSIIKSPFLRLTISPKSIIIMLMLFISIAMIYKCYSKTGWITLVTILFIWFVLRKKYIVSSLIPIIVAVILFVNPFAKDSQKTFSNEINYVTHANNTEERVFRGRLSRWGIGMQRFIELPVINKLFGAKNSIGDPENDYLRVLWHNGILGFLCYMTLLCLTGYFLISRFAGTKEVVMLMGILVFIVFIISGIGSYTMYYPNLQWFMWGTVGFIMSKDRVIVATIQ